VKNKNNPSARTIVAHDAKIKDNNITFLSYFRKSTNDVIPNKINKESVIPNNEFKIILGSNAIKATPTNAIFSSKYFLHKKYTGIIIKDDNIIEIVLCSSMYSNVLSKLIIENQNDKKIGHPLLIGVHSIGKCP
jgi:hypothetical protein